MDKTRSYLTRAQLQAYFEAVWDSVLVPHCGAPNAVTDRDGFLWTQVEDKYPTSQYRFCGLFGFGGKLMTDHELRCSVSYYQEDRTEQREATQKVANAKLQDLWTTYVSRYLPA